jgi:hypothetical protein
MAINEDFEIRSGQRGNQGIYVCRGIWVAVAVADKYSGPCHSASYFNKADRVLFRFFVASALIRLSKRTVKDKS